MRRVHAAFIDGHNCCNVYVSLGKQLQTLLSTVNERGYLTQTTVKSKLYQMWDFIRFKAQPNGSGPQRMRKGSSCDTRCDHVTDARCIEESTTKPVQAQNEFSSAYVRVSPPLKASSQPPQLKLKPLVQVITLTIISWKQ